MVVGYQVVQELQEEALLLLLSLLFDVPQDGGDHGGDVRDDSLSYHILSIFNSTC